MSNSDYKADALLAKEKLSTVSDTMCLAKWNQTSLHLPTGLRRTAQHTRETGTTTADVERGETKWLFILLEDRGHRRDVGQALQVR